MDIRIDTLGKAWSLTTNNHFMSGWLTPASIEDIDRVSWLNPDNRDKLKAILTLARGL